MTMADDYGPGLLLGEDFTPAHVLWDRVARGASALASLGVEAGDRVALLMRNDIPLFEVSYAAAALGASPVPINWHGTAEEVSYVLEDCSAKVLIAHADLLNPLRDGLPSAPALFAVATPELIATTYKVDPAATSVPDDVDDWSRWIEGFEPRVGEPPQPPLAMIYTSGTTGRPKGVKREMGPSEAPEQLAKMAEERMAIMGFSQGMRTVVTGPMYHSAPNAFGLTSARMDGFVVLQPRFDAEQLLALIERHRIGHLSLVPTMFVRLLRLDPEVRARYDLSSLTHIVHGAAPCPPEVKRAMIDWLGPILHEYYGGTETGVVAGCNSHEWLAHPGTVGKPLSNVELRIYGDDGNEVPQGEPGEIFMWAKGFPDFTYEGREDERQACERDGLVTCGDVGYLDEDGFLHLCDRKRDMVISGGVNIYPAEIESCLVGMPGVRDCAVFGVPDPEFGEALLAALERDPGAEVTEDDVKAYIRSRLAGFKVPRTVVFHDSLPREDSGKIFKRKLRAPYWEGTGRAI